MLPGAVPIACLVSSCRSAIRLHILSMAAVTCLEAFCIASVIVICITAFKFAFPTGTVAGSGAGPVSPAVAQPAIELVHKPPAE